jgi:hypothetical protein
MVSSSGSDIATPTCARSIAWPPAIPDAPAACASNAHACPASRSELAPSVANACACSVRQQRAGFAEAT